MYYYYKHKDDVTEPYSVCYERKDMLTEAERIAKNWVYLGDSIWFEALPGESVYLYDYDGFDDYSYDDFDD